jgi:HEPN domain-containing protein
MLLPDDRLWKLIGGRQNFDTYLRDIDAELAYEEIPINMRHITALRKISDRHSIAVSIFGGSFSEAVHNWFKAKYDEKVYTSTCIGEIAVIISGAPYRVIFPLGYGAIRINPLTLIEAATPGLFNSMPNSEITKLANLIGENYQAALQSGYRVDGMEHHIVAVKYAVDTPQNFNLALYESALSVEKGLKAYIKGKGARAPKNHELSDLADRAEKLGLTPTDRGLLKHVYCESSVRYGDPKVSLRDAVKAIQAASKLRSAISNSL